MKKILSILCLSFLIAPITQGAPAHVQSDANGTACTGTTSCTCAFGSNTTAASLLVSYSRISAIGRTVTTSDTQTNTYGSPDVTATDTTDAGVATITAAANTAGGADTITSAISGAAANIRTTCSEYSGVALSGELDTTANAEGGGTTIATGAVTPSVDGALFLVAAGNASSAVFTAGTDFTERSGVPSGAGNNNRFFAESYVQTTAASHDGTATQSQVLTWMAALAVYKPLSAAAAVTNTPKNILNGQVIIPGGRL